MNWEQEIERLKAENTELRQLLAASREELAAVLARLAEIEEGSKGRKEVPSFVKPARKKAGGDERRERKKRAAEHNKSRKRAQPTRIERHALEHCPECNYRLRGESVAYTREVIEIPRPQPVEVIEHQVIKRWCPCCEAWRRPQLDLSGQVIGQGRIGTGIASLVAYLRTTLRLPIQQIQEYLETLHMLRLGKGTIAELTHDVRQQLQGTADKLLEQARSQAIVHQDETGWRENGQNGYVWTVATDGPQAVRYYEYDHSRSHEVACRLVGLHFRGVLVSDFYAAYNLVRSRHQRCWVHLLRDLHELKEKHAADATVIDWAQKVRKLYDTAQEWLQDHPAATVEQRTHQYDQLVTETDVLGLQYALTYDHPCCALAKRLLRHRDELFLFILIPGLPAHNNLAERSIRPVVVIRKISGGSRSPEGSHTRLLLASVFATWIARQLNPLDQCRIALQSPVSAVRPAPT